MEALKERGMLLKNAPHLVKNQSFIVPNYKWWEGAFYGLGLKVYDWMAGSLGLGPSEFLSREETLERAPTLDAEGLRGGVLYHDGQFDDARLALHLAMTAADHGAVLINYCNVTSLIKEQGRVCGLLCSDSIDGKEFEIKAKAIINATGVFADSILQMDDAAAEKIVAPSQGIHLVFDKEFLPGDTAIMIPRTDDKRVLFAVPWHGKIIAGTTDTPVSNAMDEPIAMEEEVGFVLKHIARYLTKDPTPADIRSIFAGLRPLVKGNAKITATLSRDHHIAVSASELITITGGKWTTYRKMAEDVMEIAIHKAGLDWKDCRTADLPIHGHQEVIDFSAPRYYYGSDITGIEAIMQNDLSAREKIHPGLPYTWAEIVWAVNEEMCMTVEDALSRRTRALFLDARAAIECAPAIAAKLAMLMGKDKPWEKQQVIEFEKIAENYLPHIK
jgi:glycerol-3-phosphate dehydrogenase